MSNKNDIRKAQQKKVQQQMRAKLINDYGSAGRRADQRAKEADKKKK